MPTQTPASRRFVLPSSTAPDRSQKQHGFASQFARSSHASSSPFTRTLFSSTARKQRKDDIVADGSQDDDLDEDEYRPSHGLTQETAMRRLAKPLDELTDDGDLPGYPQDTTLTAPTQLSQLQKPRASQFRSVKRRKTSHPTSENIDDEPNVSSPPSSPTHDHNEDQSAEAHLHIPNSSPPPPGQGDSSPGPARNRSSSPHSSSSAFPAHDFQTPKQHKSRFRDPVAGILPSTPALASNATPQQAAVYPSFQSRLLASTSTPAATATSPGPHLRGPRPTLDLTLPDAFSPSRKRGAHEYIYGGVAETVRGWVVDMATMVAGHTTTPVKSTVRHAPVMQSVEDEGNSRTDNIAPANENTLIGKIKVVVKEVLMVDKNGRFVLIRSRSQAQSHSANASDDSIWMLINTDPQPRKTSTNSRADMHSSLMGVQPGKIVNIRGGDTMIWELNMDLNVNSDSATVVDAATKTKLAKCKVAVLWDVT